MINILINSSSIINNVIQKEPGVIVGPITKFLGYILNGVFEFAWIFSPAGANCLGIAIILLTIITRIFMIPLALKQQKSTIAMQRVMPEMEKIKAKYGNSKDREKQQKMAAEQQALYAKHKINPLAGCLPSLIQLPIFFALNYMIRQAYLFINEIGGVYNKLAVNLIDLYHNGILQGSTIMEVANPKVPANMQPFNLFVDGVGDVSNFEMIINKMTALDWITIKNSIPADARTALEGLLAQKESIEHFIGINLINVSGLSFPGIIIPILTVVLTFLQTYLMSKTTSTSTDPNAQSMQKIMLYMMPIMMGYFTVTFSAGVGIYWITLTVFGIAQQYFINKYYKPRLDAQFNEKSNKIVSVQ